MPPISEEEALAILDRFLVAERGSLKPNSLLHFFHWRILTTIYCPLREEFSVLRKLVEKGFLIQSSSTEEEEKSWLKWPLTITKEAVSEMRKARWSVWFPWGSQLHDSLKAVLDRYPLYAKGAGLIFTWEFGKFLLRAVFG
ncbi:hypothetical protein MYX65_01200 [Acidobacteria bacterium AH-259-L09]|nr:hypothetical protein [Acidobacteria bacterium AH-259-L09]